MTVVNQQYNEKLFQTPELWENYDPIGKLKKKADILLQHIPSDVETILDIGCGNGIITNHFGKRYDVTGVDNSKSALEFIDGKRILASAEEIPVQPLSYDMVFSSEMIEHLPDTVLEKSLREMRRISKKYIFITVPYKEHLERSYVKCSACDQTFHIYGHLQSFSLKDISRELTDFKLIWNTTMGNKVRTYNRKLLKIRQQWFGQYFKHTEHTICPYCQNDKFNSPPRNLGTMILNGLNKVVSSKKDYWLACLFERI